jgi:hypothetical protein
MNTLKTDDSEQVLFRTSEIAPKAIKKFEKGAVDWLSKYATISCKHQETPHAYILWRSKAWKKSAKMRKYRMDLTLRDKKKRDE